MELIYGGGVYFKRRGLIIRLLQNKRCDVRIRLSNKYVFYLKKKKKKRSLDAEQVVKFFFGGIQSEKSEALGVHYLYCRNMTVPAPRSRVSL